MRQLILSLALLFASLPAVAAELPRPELKANLTILADEDVLLPLAQIARAYAIDTKTPLTVVVKNADEAEEQIEQGLEAHVLITANYALLGRLTEQGMTDVSSRKPVARTQLALITASSDLGNEANIAKRISFASMLSATDGVPVYLDAPDSIEGERGARLLSGQEFSPTLSARAEVKPNHEELISSLRDGTSLGLVLAASTVIEKDIRILSLLNDEVSPPVLFDSVVLGSESMGDAKNFSDYLSTRKARAIFSNFGFQAPTK